LPTVVVPLNVSGVSAGRSLIMSVGVVTRPRRDIRVRSIKRYGWIPDLPDIRDRMYAAPDETLVSLPPKVDLRPNCPPVYDQGQLGTSAANAIAAAVQFERETQRLPGFVPSRLFIYFSGRVVGGTVPVDSGTQIRDVIKTIANQGVPPEADWPYDITKFAQKPPAAAYRDAVHDRALIYSRLVQNLNQMKGCLASGHPFVFGFTIYDSFESEQVAKTGVMPMPAVGEAVLGGHAVMAAGYDDSQQRFIVRNSWGTGWGMGGYFTTPYAYLMERNLSSDFWTIRFFQ
jgi:C1A family cysteine protease